MPACHTKPGGVEKVLPVADPVPGIIFPGNVRPVLDPDTTCQYQEYPRYYIPVVYGHLLIMILIQISWKRLSQHPRGSKLSTPKCRILCFRHVRLSGRVSFSQGTLVSTVYRFYLQRLTAVVDKWGWNFGEIWYLGMEWNWMEPISQPSTYKICGPGEFTTATKRDIWGSTHATAGMPDCGFIST